MKILISGGTGFVGNVLVGKLLEKGHQVVLLTRNCDKAQTLFKNHKNFTADKVTTIEWKSYNDIPDLSPFKTIDAVINLVGENIADKRWSNEQKKEIFNSRIDGTTTIYKALKKAGITPDVFISTSAIGAYGPRNGEELFEDAVYGDDFMAKVCKSWEKVVFDHQDAAKRSAILRLGIVLGKDGGAIQKMLTPFSMGLGGKLGSGEQFMSWIHIVDLANMFIQVLEDDKLSGTFNATSPYPVNNGEFTKVLGNVLRKPTPFPVPGFMINILMGGVSEVLLTGQNVLPKKFKENRFHYRYPTLEIALKEVISK